MRYAALRVNSKLQEAIVEKVLLDGDRASALIQQLQRRKQTHHRLKIDDRISLEGRLCAYTRIMLELRGPACQEDGLDCSPIAVSGDYALALHAWITLVRPACPQPRDACSAMLSVQLVSSRVRDRPLSSTMGVSFPAYEA